MLPAELTDGELIRRSIDDPLLFEGVFDRHYDQIFRYVVRRVGAADGPDIAADVFVVAFEQRTRFWADQESAAPWLFGIAANLAKRHARSQARRNRAYLKAAQPHNPDSTADRIVDRVDAEAQAGALNQAMGSLRSRDREVLLLVALSDLSYQEVAQALNIPVGTVRSCLSRTRARLRTELGPHWNDDTALGKGGVE